MSSSRTRQRRPKRPHCFMCETVLSDGPSSSAASSQQRQRQRRTETVYVPTAPSVPSITSIAASSTTTPIGSSSTSSSSASLPLHSPTSIQRRWQQRRSATVFVPTPSPPSSSIVTQPIVPSGPSSLPSSSTMTSADVGSSSSMMPALASAPSRPSSLAPSAATPVNVPSEPSFQDPALAERYWNYDHQKVSLSDAVAAERAFAAAPPFVKRRLGSGEQPPWFWGQNSAKYFTLIKREDMEEEKSVCAVCIDEYREFQPCYILSCCFHFFHCRCLLGWWVHCSLQGKEMTCPLCRSIAPDSPISSPCEIAA